MKIPLIVLKVTDPIVEAIRRPIDLIRDGLKEHALNTITKEDDDLMKENSLEKPILAPDIGQMPEDMQITPRFCGALDELPVPEPYAPGDFVLINGEMYVCTYAKEFVLAGCLEDDSQQADEMVVECKGCGNSVLIGHRCEYCGRLAGA